MFVVNVEGAIYNDGKWLLILRSKKEEHAGGTLSLVGGKVDQEGNSTDILERTLKREIYEEVGVEVTDLVYVNSTTFVTDYGAHVVDIVFLCKHLSGEAFAKSMDEVDDVYWLTTDEIIEDTNLPSYVRNSIRLADKVRIKQTDSA
ncbi:NUDIX hydrolase [Peribacillus deserti]|uniref:DNA mismatch repair protein MutT n=1 Tax=Peribacillus deserti TaxID=673318 RepID=A0A2N5M193_9BACI|nr:NUDIX domain-containing protein [Peribacillus deserti]PLT28122.1 DNA mismatch repair protein MutT [Peribacillus deserti]